MNTLHFDLRLLDAAHRREVENGIEIAARRATRVRVVSEHNQAEAVVVIGGSEFGRERWPATLAENEFVWCATDHPTGFERGLYCSLPKSLFNPARHASYCYPVRYNEQIQPFDTADARYLFSFVGGVTSGTRARLLRYFSGKTGDWVVQASSGPWNAMFDRSGLEIKTTFAESIRRSRFVLCPRGNGAGSIRMFETMEAARVPVILSDRYVLPEGVDWTRCAVVVPEQQFRDIPRILQECLGRWEEMARAARHAWEACFSPNAWPDRIAEVGDRLLQARPPGLAEQARIRGHGAAMLLRRRLGSLRDATRTRS